MIGAGSRGFDHLLVIHHYGRGIGPPVPACILAYPVGTSNSTRLSRLLCAAPARRCVACGASHRAGSTASMCSSTRKRCAQSPCAPRAPTRDYASSAHVCCPRLDRSHSMGVTEHGSLLLGCAPIAVPARVAMGPPLQRLRRCVPPGMLELGTLLAPSCSLPSDRTGSIRARRHLHVRSRARRRLRRDGLRLGRHRGRRRRHRRLLRRPLKAARAR